MSPIPEIDAPPLEGSGRPAPLEQLEQAPFDDEPLDSAEAEFLALKRDLEEELMFGALGGGDLGGFLGGDLLVGLDEDRLKDSVVLSAGAASTSTPSAVGGGSGGGGSAAEGGVLPGFEEEAIFARERTAGATESTSVGRGGSGTAGGTTGVTTGVQAGRGNNQRVGRKGADVDVE